MIDSALFICISRVDYRSVIDSPKNTGIAFHSWLITHDCEAKKAVVKNLRCRDISRRWPRGRGPIEPGSGGGWHVRALVARRFPNYLRRRSKSIAPPNNAKTNVEGSGSGAFLNQ
jgi:hypothetical protein